MNRKILALAAIVPLGCASLIPTTHKGASLILKPCINSGYLTQTTVNVYNSASIDHLVIKLFQGSTELATQSIPQLQLSNSIVFSNLRPNTSYCVKSYAYLANNAIISNEASSSLSFTTGIDDRPNILQLPVYLIDRPFNGQGSGSVQVTNGGYIPGDPELVVNYQRVMFTVAGNGTTAFTGDGGAASSAALRNPYDVTADESGNVYIADWDSHRVRKVSPAGIITTVAGNGTSGYSAGQDGGPATNAYVARPNGVALDSAGNLYISDSTNRIRKVTPVGIISTIAGNGSGAYAGDGGPATSASLFNPMGLRFDNSGNLYVADWTNHRIRKISPAGIITTVAGGGAATGDGGVATSAYLAAPSDVDFDSLGNLYVADRDTHRIRKVSPTGIITTVAGNGVASYSGDGGPATNASMHWPWGIAVDPYGILYIADEGNQRIRKVSPDGTITTVAGYGDQAYYPAQNGGLATAVSLQSPVGMNMDPHGNLYVAVYGHSVVRKIQWKDLEN